MFRLLAPLALGVILAGCGLAPHGTSTSRTESADVAATASSQGVTFSNATQHYVWVSFTLQNCHNVSPANACTSRYWYKTISLSPRSQQEAVARCAFDSGSSSSATLSYTIQWVAYVDTSAGNLYQPPNAPPYSRHVGHFTHVNQNSAYSLLETCLNAGL